MQPFGLLDNRYSSDDPRFALNYAGGGASGETPTNADALGRLAYGLTNVGGVQDAAGLLGGPSVADNIKRGNNLDASLQMLAALPMVGMLGTAGKAAKAAKVGEDIAEPWYRVAANKLAERAGEGYRAAHSKASFGDSSYVNGPEFSVRFSDHSANPNNRTNQMMITSQTDRQTGRFIPPSYDEDTAWRFLTNNPSPEEMLNRENKLKLLQGAYDEKRALAQQAYDAELSKGGKNAHKRAIGAARQIQSGFSL